MNKQEAKKVLEVSGDFSIAGMDDDGNFEMIDKRGENIYQLNINNVLTGLQKLHLQYEDVAAIEALED